MRKNKPLKKPLILIVNDDGISAPGISALIEAAAPFGQIVVVAPDKPQSGMGHAVTLNTAIRVNSWEKEGIRYHSCSGTPVDCVKMGVSKLLPKKPDLILSGINHGANSSINVIYSGTMSAAIEGAMEGIPSIGFSLCNHSIEANFESSKVIVSQILKKMFANSPQPLCLNVNIPDIPYELIQGIKVCRQANGCWEEDFDERTDPSGKKYYWLTGKFVTEDTSNDTDEWALKNNYVSVVPIQFDFTNYNIINKLIHFEND